MFIKSIDIQGLLSFRNASLEMRPLNVLIGPNASGKSNFIEIMALLQALPRDLAGFISRGGGISDWLWKGKPDGAVAGGVRLEVNNPVSVLPHDVAAPLAYSLRIMQEAGRTAIQHESMSVLNIGNNGSDGSRLFETANGTANVTRLSTYPGDGTVDIPPRAVKTGQSLLRDLRDPRHYPEISYVRDAFDAIRLYRDLALGPKSNMRIPVRSDEMPDYLVEDMSNLALVLSNLKLDPVCESIIEYMKKVYSRFEDFTPSIIGGTVQLWVREEGLAKSIPATRLSDGTLRFLALLTILLHPSPPPLICIEEPELGLHPDIIPTVADLLKSASERTQLIVTTHSVDLVECLGDMPESVVVCEREPEDGTQLRRLSESDMALWLERFNLGELWEMGEIGGNRW